MTKILDELRTEVEAFLRVSGMPHTTFGINVAGDPSLVTRLRSGRDFRASAIDRIRAYIRNYRPPFATVSRKKTGEPRHVA